MTRIGWHLELNVSVSMGMSLIGKTEGRVR